MHLAIRQWTLGCVAALLLVGSATAFASTEHGRPMSFRHLTVAHGLSQNTIMDMWQDHVGYVWFATENGLDRFDGYGFTRYQRGSVQQGELANDYIWQIGEDQRGNLWLATDGGGVARWVRSRDAFVHYQHRTGDRQSLSSDRTRTLLVTPSGIWVGTQEHGLNFIDLVTGKVTRYQHDPADPHSLPNDGVYSLLLDAAQNLWVGTDDGLARFNAAQQTFDVFRHDASDAGSLGHNKVRALANDRNGQLWVGTSGGGVSVLDPRTLTFRHHRHDAQDANSLSHNHVRSILEDDAGRIWIGTVEGLDVSLTGSGVFHRYQSGDGKYDLSDDYVMSLMQDRGGVLWIGTRTGGASRWHSDSWRFGHYNNQTLSRHSVTSFTSDYAHAWIGTFGGGLSRVNRKTGAYTEVELPLAAGEAQVMALAKDRLGGLWVGTMSSGLLWRRSELDPFIPFAHDPSNPASLSSNGVMSIFEGRDGDMWLGTYGGGISRFDREAQAFERFAAPAATAGCGRQARSIAEDRFGNLWIATELGLCVLEVSTGRVTAFQHQRDNPQSLPENSVFAVHLDDAGVLWAGTGGAGLVKVEPAGDIRQTRFTTFSRSHGLASNMVYGLLSDDDRNIWLSGNGGLTRFDPRTEQATVYRRSQGLQGDEFHFGSAHKAEDGTLFSAVRVALTSFDRASLFARQSPPMW